MKGEFNLLSHFDIGAAIFDFDDTLVATFEVRRHTLRKALAEFGHRVDESEIVKRWGLPFNELVLGLAPVISLERFIPYYEVYMNSEPPRLQPCVVEVLSELRRLDVYCCVHSSSHTSLIRADLRALSCDVYFDDIFGADRTVRAKPDPLSLDVVMAELSLRNISRDRCVYFGDSPRDLAVASANNLAFVGVATGQTSANEFRSLPGVAMAIESFCDLT